MRRDRGWLVRLPLGQPWTGRRHHTVCVQTKDQRDETVFHSVAGRLCGHCRLTLVGVSAGRKAGCSARHRSG